MTTMLNSAAVMGAALLLVAEMKHAHNPKCQHLVAVEIMKL